MRAIQFEDDYMNSITGHEWQNKNLIMMIGVMNAFLYVDTGKIYAFRLVGDNSN